MKCSFLLAMLLISTTLLSQSSFNVTFDGFNSGDAAGDAIESLDGGAYLYGSASNASQQNLVLIKTDCKGDTLWKRIFYGLTAQPAVNISRKVSELPNGDLMLLAVFRSDSLLVLDVVLLKVNSGGDLLWVKHVGELTWDEDPEDFYVLPDGSIIVVGMTTNALNGGSDAFVYKFDSEGLEIWTYRTGGQWSDRFKSVTIDTQGNIIVSGKSMQSTGYYAAFIVKLDSLGNELWEVIRPYPKSGSAKDIIAVDQDRLAIAISYNDANNVVWGEFLLFDSSSTEITSVIRGNGFDHYSYIGIVKSTYGHHFYVSGVVNAGAPGGIQAMISRLDSIGNPLWEWIAGADTVDDYFWGINPTTDGGVIAGGETSNNSPPYDDMWLVKLDANGCIDTTCSLDCITCNFIQPLAIISVDTITIGGSVQFYDSTTMALSSYWDFDDGSQSAQSDPIHIFDDPGTYTVLLNATYGTCSDIDTVVIIVLDTNNTYSALRSIPRGLNIYPNPSDGSFNIVSDVTGHLKVFDAVGRLVKESHLEAFKTRRFVLKQAGMYLVLVTSLDGVVERRKVLLR